MKKAVLVHLNWLPGSNPLSGGYLKASAERFDDLRATWDIAILSASVRVAPSRILDDLWRRSPDVVGFSGYVWNHRRILALLGALRALLPRTRFLLGGTQFQNHADGCVPPSWEDVATCDGEGEVTFPAYLREMGLEKPDLERVPGLTFQRGGERVTTSASGPPDLALVPSPFLAGYFGPTDLRSSMLETNRGCPYRCAYCYWGGPVGGKVRHRDPEVVREEIEYVSRAGAYSLMVIDANFGMFERDVEVAEHIVRCRERFGAPNRVFFFAAKSRPDRALRITRVLDRGGIDVVCPVSLQSASPRALELAGRRNVETRKLLELQEGLNRERLSSYVELIWPMPGETLDSFKDGIARLAGAGSQAFHIHPLLLIHNIGYEERRLELGLVTLEEASSAAGGGEKVIQTREVTYPDYREGLRYAFSLLALHDLRGLHLTSRILARLGVRFRDLLDDFSAWLDRRPDVELATLRDEGLGDLDIYHDFQWPGRVAEAMVHARRNRCDELLLEFVLDRPWSAGPHRRLVRAALELDLVCRPYAFADTAMELGIPLLELAVVSRDPEARTWVLDAPFDLPGMLEPGEAWPLERSAVRFRVAHVASPAPSFAFDSSTVLDLCWFVAREPARFRPAIEPLAR